MQEFDQILFTWIQSLAHPVLDWLMVLTSHSTLGLLLGLAAALWLANRKTLSRAIVLSVGVTLVLTVIFQVLAARPAPSTELEGRLLWPLFHFPAFPSGTTASAFTVAVLLGMIWQKPHRWAIVLGYASLVGFSRIYIGHHYPTDAIAGAILGTAIGLTVYGLCFTKPNLRQGLSWLLWPQIALVMLITGMAYLNILPLYIVKWPYSDKVMHFFLFGMIVFWLNLWFEDRRLRILGLAVPLAILVPFTFTALEEGLQAFSPWRSADLLDLSSDILGMLTFWRLSILVLNYTNSETTNKSARSA